MRYAYSGVLAFEGYDMKSDAKHSADPMKEAEEVCALLHWASFYGLSNMCDEIQRHLVRTISPVTVHHLCHRPLTSATCFCSLPFPSVLYIGVSALELCAHNGSVVAPSSGASLQRLP